jgi:RimJ/RimL family protein N-acetyltransferase
LKKYRCLSKHCFRDGDYAVVAVQPEHIESIRHWRNNQLDVLRQVSPISQQQQIQYYTKNIWPSMEELQPTSILLSYLYENRPIGYGGLVHIAWQDLRAEVSFLLDPVRVGISSIYGTDFRCFLKLIKRLAFDDLGLQRLFTETYNIRQLHISTLEQSGFIREGVMRRHVRISGVPVDSIIHGCLKNDDR